MYYLEDLNLNAEAVTSDAQNNLMNCLNTICNDQPDILIKFYREPSVLWVHEINHKPTNSINSTDVSDLEAQAMKSIIDVMLEPTQNITIKNPIAIEPESQYSNKYNDGWVSKKSGGTKTYDSSAIGEFFSALFYGDKSSHWDDFLLKDMAGASGGMFGKAAGEYMIDARKLREMINTLERDIQLHSDPQMIKGLYAMQLGMKAQLAEVENKIKEWFK